MLVGAALYSGARCGVLAGLNVADFEAHMVRQPDGTEIEEGNLHVISRKGRGGRVKAVTIKLTDEGITFYMSITAGRGAADIMLPRSGGSRWNKCHQTRLIKQACENAKIDPLASFSYVKAHMGEPGRYGRHAAVRRRAEPRPLRYTQVERHYGHLAPSYRNEQVRKYAPRFGSMPEDEGVKRMHGRA